MDQFHDSDQGREGSSPPFQPNLPLHSLLADNRMPPCGSVEDAAALRQLASVSAAFPDRVAGLSDLSPLHQSPSRKRKLGYSIDHHGPFEQSLSFQAGAAFPGSVPSSFLRPDPPAARSRIPGGTDLDILLSSSSIARQPPQAYSSLQSSARELLHSFSNPALQHHDRQRNVPFMSVSRSGLTHAELSSGIPPNSTSTGSSSHRHEPEHAKGGIFDNADSEDESVRVAAPSSIAIAKPVASQPKIASSGDGIFDDAEEELSFVPPSYDSEQIAPKTSCPKESPKVSKAESKKAPATKPVPKSKKAPSGPRKASPFPMGSKADGAKGTSQKKKKSSKPTKRVLFGRKEKDQAASIMAGKDDLTGVIDLHDCRFLGRAFWIFTVQQLEFVLNATEASETTSTEDIRCRRRELLVRVAVSRLWLGPQSNQGACELPALDGLQAPLENDLATNSTQVPEKGNLPNKQARGGSTSSSDVESMNGPSQEGTNKADQETFIAQRDLPKPDPDAEEAAERLLRSWNDKILEWKRKDFTERDIPNDKKFHLDGPISCLFPTVVRRFLASVPIVTLYDFLCLKKTETGAIVALCGAWRKHCGLQEGTPLALAKHFLGMGLRTETALNSFPPPDQRTRTWMSDPIVVLTGAAREFLIDNRKLLHGKTFIDTRTKDLANALEEWRTTKGLPPLKGSGKVAMISGWKANVKEAIDLEEKGGRVLEGVDLQALVENADMAPIVKEETNAEVPTKSSTAQEFTFDPRIPDVDAALHSHQFLRDVLEPKHFAVLQTAGIKTAVELFAAEKKHGSPLALELQKALPDPSSFELVIFDWCQIVRKKLNGIRRVYTKRKGDALPDPPAKAKKGNQATQRKEKLPAQKKERPAQQKKDVPQRPSKQVLLQKDPFYSLSAVTQTFLKTLDIETAQVRSVSHILL